MTNEEIITQLQDIKCHCQEMYEAEIKNGDTSSNIWGKDVEALEMAIQALEQQPCDAISREAVIKHLENITMDTNPDHYDSKDKWYQANGFNLCKVGIEMYVKNLPSVTPKARWTLCSERLPEELEPVNITWINHNPESYYEAIKDKPFTATGVYFNGQWYWWSTLCTDILAEYSHNYDDIIDDDIEITAWKSLPQAYKAESEVEA